MMIQQFQTETEAVNWCIGFLRLKGYVVTLPEHGRPETPGEFRVRMGIKFPSQLTRLLSRPDCPFFMADRGDSKRIRTLRSNPELEEFIQRNDKAER